MSHSVVYVTAPNRAAALRMAHILVEERLVACANLLEGVTSVYWWEGTVQEETETILIAKTRDGQIPAVIARLREIHNYSCPCIVTWPMGPGNPDFLRWINTETGGAG